MHVDLTLLHSCTFVSLVTELLCALDHSSNAFALAQGASQNCISFVIFCWSQFFCGDLGRVDNFLFGVDLFTCCCGLPVETALSVVQRIASVPEDLPTNRALWA